MPLKKLIFILLLVAAKPATGQQNIYLADTTETSQLLYNGRVWRDLYHKVDGDQFFLTPEFNQGKITIEGISFHGIPLRYDSYKDEVNIRSSGGLILQINKEIVDSFSINVSGRNYNFEKIKGTGDFGGFLNVLYRGEISLMIRYRKSIELLAIDRKIDRFYEVRKMYVVIDSTPYRFSGKNNLLKLFGENRKAVNDYIRKNKLIVRKNDPASFINVVRYYDNLNK